jgi:Tfp pilus assembly protein PilN
MRPVNLVPQEQRRRAPREGGGGKGAYVALGVLGVLVVLVAAYVLSSNQVTERQNQAAAASAEADRLEAEASKQVSYTDFAAIAQTRLQSVASVAETRFDWERLMREVALVMPAGSWLQSADASVAGDAAAAAAAPAAGTTTAAPAGPSATFLGCTPDQSDVARMMVRLRQLNRVADVTLNQSATEGKNSEPAAVDSCGPNYKFDITVSFTAADVEASPRGATRVPASLGGGS